ncbi:MAG: hypothetical protein SPK80_06265 [Bacteroidales bacterium]|nr:hypothetical protein [Bacteroidales bacterium]
MKSRTFPPTTKPTNWGKASSETLKADGFVNCSNNRFDKKDMLVLVYNSKKGYTESFPIRAMRINAAGSVEVYIGTSGTIDEYLPNEG